MVVWKDKRIEIDEFVEFLTEFRDETDRAAVVLGTAKLDNVLEIILEDYLLPFDSDEDKNNFFSYNGTLGTFSSRIHMSYRLQIIDQDFFKKLHLIRNIRNQFAHNISTSKLDKSPISDQVRELSKHLVELRMFKDIRDSVFPNHEEYSANFRTVLSLLIYTLEYLSKNVSDFYSGDPFPFFSHYQLAEEIWKKKH